MRLNDLDERIVHALAEDARRSYADIGSLVGLSAPAVKRRVDRLRAEGAITGFTVRVDPAALGWETEGFVEIYCRHNTSPNDIRRGLERYPEVVCAAPGTAAPGARPPLPRRGHGAEDQAGGQQRRPEHQRGGEGPQDRADQ
ncbi:Lrp/AsnC family transcriptional regulator, partial [Streptomyces sp. NPDC058667]|uniref:Lrp/AsnC family transcriptional regulator n=1 Tax=Streptomyces sp. NPDC058667 TaxID=3346588 RepID=UPI00365CF4B6